MEDSALPFAGGFENVVDFPESVPAVDDHREILCSCQLNLRAKAVDLLGTR
jgi:hypothetical protein